MTEEVELLTIPELDDELYDALLELITKAQIKHTPVTPLLPYTMGCPILEKLRIEALQALTDEAQDRGDYD